MKTVMAHILWVRVSKTDLPIIPSDDACINVLAWNPKWVSGVDILSYWRRDSLGGDRNASLWVDKNDGQMEIEDEPMYFAYLPEHPNLELAHEYFLIRTNTFVNKQDISQHFQLLDVTENPSDKSRKDFIHRFIAYSADEAFEIVESFFRERDN